MSTQDRAVQRAPTLEVFVLSYNRPAYLRQCVLSIVNQSFAQLSVTILDNASTEDTSSVIDGIRDSRLSFQTNERNLGVVGNFQRAVQLSRADYTIIFHDDDVMSPRLIERMWDIVSQRPDVSCVIGRARMTRNDAIELAKFPDADEFRYSVFGTAEDLLDAFWSDRLFGFSSVMYRTDALRQSDPDPKLLGEVFDRPLLLKMAQHGPAAFLESPSYNVRSHADQESNLVKWGYEQELAAAALYQKLSPRNRRGTFQRRIGRAVAHAYAVRRPRPALFAWLRATRQRGLGPTWLLIILIAYFVPRVVAGRTARRLIALWSR